MESIPPAPRLEPVLTGSGYTDNYEIVFINDAPGGALPTVRSTVTKVEEGHIDNHPYAANEYYTFRAELARLGEVFLATVTELKVLYQAGAKVDENALYFKSLDGGSTWLGIYEWDRQALVEGAAPEVLSQICGPRFKGDLSDV